MPEQDVNETDGLQIGSHRCSNRLIVGTGKYADYEIMGESLARSGTECITVAVRRERLVDAAGNNLLDFIDTSRYTLLPNTAGCFNADDAVRVARLTPPGEMLARSQITAPAGAAVTMARHRTNSVRSISEV